MEFKFNKQKEAFKAEVEQFLNTELPEDWPEKSELPGIIQATFDMSVAYATKRKQFGRSIGSFQAIQHHCDNMVSARLQKNI